MPVFTGRTYRDVTAYTSKVQQWGLSCEADKAAIRDALGDAP